MAASSALAPVRRARDTEGMSSEEEFEHLAHSSHPNWLLTQELTGRIERMEAFEEDIQKLPLVNKELKGQQVLLEILVLLVKLVLLVNKEHKVLKVK